MNVKNKIFKAQFYCFSLKHRISLIQFQLVILYFIFDKLKYNALSKNDIELKRLLSLIKIAKCLLLEDNRIVIILFYFY